VPSIFQRVGRKLDTVERVGDDEGEKVLDFVGATRRIRTDDLLITNS
jgi:hypothetical protein